MQTKYEVEYCQEKDCTNKWSAVSFHPTVMFRCYYHWLLYYTAKQYPYKTLTEEWKELNLLHPLKYSNMQEFINKWTK